MKDLPARLAAAGEAVPAAPEFAGKVMERLPRERRAHGDRRRFWFTRSRWALAACLLVGFGLWTIFGGREAGGGGNLHAQAVAAFEEAKSMRGVGTRWENGKQVERTEVLYDRAAGVHVRTESDGHAEIYIDDGRYQWRYGTEERVVRKSFSSDTAGPARGILTAAAERIDGARRERGGDVTIDGTRCRHYVSVGELTSPAAVKFRSHHWLDSGNRLRRYEQEILRDGKWERSKLAEIQYDVAIDRAAFEPKPPPDAEIVDIAGALDRVVSLEKAVHQQEAMGAVIAVHRVERLRDGCIYVVASVRPTDATRRLVGSDGPETWFAVLDIGDSIKRLDARRWRQYRRQELATLNHDGLYAVWALLEPAGDWPEGFEQYDLSFSVSILHDRWAARLRSQGMAIREELESAALLPMTVGGASVSDVAADVHGQLSTLEPMVATTELRLKPAPYTDAEMEPSWQRGTPREFRLHHNRTVKPSGIEVGAYRREVAAMLEEARTRAAASEARRALRGE